MITASEHHASGQTILDHRLTPADAAEHRVAVLSAALLRAVMNTYGEDHEGFADRAGVPAGVVEARSTAPTRPGHCHTTSSRP